MSRNIRPASLLLLASLSLSILLSCDMLLSTELLAGAHEHDGIAHASLQHDDVVCASTTQHEADVDCADETRPDAMCTTACTESDEADDCCAPGSDDCALPCWYCGCAHSFSTAVTGVPTSPIPLLLQGSVPETVSATLATDRPRLIHPPSIA